MLKLGDCEGLRVAALQSPTLESLQLSQCRWLERVQLDCPMLTQASCAGLAWLQAVGLGLGPCKRNWLLECAQLHCPVF